MDINLDLAEKHLNHKSKNKNDKIVSIVSSIRLYDFFLF